MPQCPRPDCPGSVIRKFGRRRTQDGLIQRYQCGTCRTTWSTTPRARRPRPDLDRFIFELSVSGVSMRRIALLLHCGQQTVRNTTVRLAQQIRSHHIRTLTRSRIRTGHVMMDELETYLDAHWKQVSVVVIVRAKATPHPRTGKPIHQVLSFRVCRHPSRMRGHGADDLQPWIHNTRSTGIPQALREAKVALRASATITTDGDPSYPAFIAKALPGVNHRVPGSGPGSYDPLFPINHTHALMRHDLARLARKTWTTSKTVEGLENHLWLWVAWNNGYRLR